MRISTIFESLGGIATGKVTENAGEGCEGCVGRLRACASEVCTDGGARALTSVRALQGFLMMMMMMMMLPLRFSICTSPCTRSLCIRTYIVALSYRIHFCVHKNYSRMYPYIKCACVRVRKRCPIEKNGLRVGLGGNENERETKRMSRRSMLMLHGAAARLAGEFSEV